MFVIAITNEKSNKIKKNATPILKGFDKKTMWIEEVKAKAKINFI